MNFRHALDPDMVLELVWAVVRGAIGFVVFFALSVASMLLLAQDLEAVLPRLAVNGIGDELLRIGPVVGLVLGALMINARVRGRTFLILLGLVFGTIGGVILGRNLAGLLISSSNGISLMVVPVGTLLGGWLGNLVFTLDDDEREVEDDETNLEKSPLYDRDMDG